MKKHSYITLAAGLLASVSILTACQKQSTEITDASPETNFYNYVNKEWLESAVIPDDDYQVAAFSELSEEIDDKIKADVEALVSGKETSDLTGMDEFIELYQVATDFDRRDKEGTNPARQFLDSIDELTSIDDLLGKAEERILNSQILPFSVGITVSAEQTDKKMMAFSAPGPLLPDTSYYEDKTTKKQLQTYYRHMAEPLLQHMGYDKNEAKAIVSQAFAFDEAIVPYLKSAEERSDIKSQFNERSKKEVQAYSKNIDLTALAESLVGQDLDEFSVIDPAYFEAFDKLLTEDNFENIKSWMILNAAYNMSAYLDQESAEIVATYQKILTGVEVLPDREETARQLAVNTFYPVFSVYYGQKHFGDEAKQDVTAMIDQIVDVYQERLTNNDWLSEETKTKAIEKLEKMTYYVGYPEEVPQDVEMVDFDTEKSLLDNMADMQKITVTYNFEHFNDPIDKTVWDVPAYMVNAFYDPTGNRVVLPAAILSEPFYSVNQSAAENFGAIGTVIGHEISHAFDNNGALFDADGNMKDWWTAEDFAAFEEKTQAMVELFDGVEAYGGQVNGQLTVSENIADAGGLSASLEALKKTHPDSDLKEYFSQYATISRSKIRPEVGQYLLLDVHAPDELRVNLQVNLLPDFYSLYNVKEGDAMFLPEYQRVSIW